jgi:VCBS repeat-containing protein
MIARRRTLGRRAGLIPAVILLALISSTAWAAPVTQEIKMDYFGYRPSDVKVAIFTSNPGSTVQVRTTGDSVVYTVPTDGGSITSMGFDDQPTGDDVWQVDFSGFSTPGSYRLYVPSWGEQSYDFDLAEDIYNEVGKVAVKTYYYQRCGCAHPSPYAESGWTDNYVCHSYMTAMTPASGEPNYGTLDLSGGWHDAGDYNKYIWGDLAVMFLLLAYENNPGAFYDGQLNIPESSNGVPDLLDEVKYEIDWLLKMQMPGGEVLSRVWDAYGGAPDSCPPSDAVHDHHYYGPTLESGSIFTGAVAMFARICEDEGDPYGNVSSLKQAARDCWNNYVVSAGDSDQKCWAAAELWRMDQSITSAKNYVEGFHADSWSGVWLSGYAADCFATYAYIQTPGANTTVVNNMKGGLGGAVNEYFSNSGLYRNSMYEWAYHWGSNRPRAAFGFLLTMAAKLGATGSHTGTECMELAEEFVHFFHGQNPMRMVYLTNMAAYGGEHSSWQFFHSWFGVPGNSQSAAWYIGKPSSVTEPDYPYFKGTDNFGVNDNNSSTYGPAPGFIVGGPNKDYGGLSVPPKGETYYGRFYRDWCDDSWQGGGGAQTWEITENSIGYQAAYVGLIAAFMSSGAGGPPVANDDYYSTDQDVPLNVAAPGVLGNDYDPDSDPMTAIKVSDPSHGSASLNSDGSFTYTPDSGYTGDDSFTYKANDGDEGDSNVATVNIAVNVPVVQTPYGGTPWAIPGTIEAEDYDEGGEGVAYHDADSGNSGGQYRTEGVDIETCGEGGYNVGWINAGEWLEYTVDVASGGSHDFELRVASDSAGGTLHIEFGGADKTGPITVPVTGGWQTWTSVNATGVSLDAGEQVMRIAMDSSGFNLNLVTVTGGPANDPPVANDDSYSTDEDQTLNVSAPGVLGNDSDPNEDPLTAIKVSDPSHGSVTLNSNGSFTYTPDGDYNGGDSFTYKANDGLADSNTATVNITVNAVNDPPVANDDSYSTDEDETLNVSAPGVLGNDSDVEDDPLSAIKVSDPSHGSVTLNSNGSFSYTPDAGYSGSDSFTYKANDGAADSNTATVNISVSSVNDPPVANDDSYGTDEDQTLNVSAPGVLGNDSDPNEDPLTAIKVSDPSHGSVTLDSNGSFTYTPDGSYNGGDSFTYKANDGLADSNTATVSITVNAVNDPPVAVGDSYSTEEDQALNVSAPGVLANDSDIDEDPLSAIKVSDPSNGSVTLNSNGSFTYTPDPGYVGDDSFTYKANDGSADSNTVAVDITVTPATVYDAAIMEAETAPTIDGSVDAVWSDAATYSIANTLFGETGGSDLSGTWRALWDASNLYYLFEVTDEAFQNDSANPWEDDAVELYIDADNSKGTSYDGVDDYQLVMRWNDSTLHLGVNSATNITGMVFDIVTVSGGYVCEISIPWSTLGQTASQGKLIGTDVHVNDDDDGGSRDGKIAWFTTVDSSWENPSLFATAELVTGGGDVTPPDPPTNLAAIGGDSVVALDWDDNSEPDLASYSVYRDTSSSGPYSQIDSGVPVSAYSDTSVTNGVTYYYVVTAVDTSSNESGYSNEASATPQGDTTPPAAPTNLSATAGDGVVDLDWDDNSEPDLASYSVYRDTSSGGPYSQIDSGVSASSYPDTSVTNGVTYYYVVTAVDVSSNESGYSNEANATPQDTTPPAAPTNLSATGGDGVVDLDWDDNSEPDLASYSVYRDTSSGGPYAQIDSGVASSDYSDTSVTNGVTYYYVVTAVDTASNESGYSNEASATPDVQATTMHVDSIVVEWVSAGGPNRKGQATVVVKDNLGNPVQNATVTGTFTGTLSETQSGTTGATGTAVIQTRNKTKSPGGLTFCVEAVTHATLSYASGDNVETCDSI